MDGNWITNYSQVPTTTRSRWVAVSVNTVARRKLSKCLLVPKTLPWFNTGCQLGGPVSVFQFVLWRIRHVSEKCGQYNQGDYLFNFSACNVLFQDTDGIYTLRNYGKRSNCSISTLFPAAVKVAALNIGVTSVSRGFEIETGTIHKVRTQVLHAVCFYFRSV